MPVWCPLFDGQAVWCRKGALACKHSGVQEGFRFFPWWTDASHWHSSISQLSHKIPSPWELIFFSLNYAWKQAKSKNLKLIEKYPHPLIARLVFGLSTIGFSLVKSQAETTPWFCWLRGHLTGECFQLINELPWSCLMETSHRATLP